MKLNTIQRPGTLKTFFRALSLLCLLLTAGWPAAVQAQYSFTSAGGASTITSFSGSGAVIIPDTLGGFPVRAIAAFAFNGLTGISSVTISSNVTTIATNAFFQCTGMSTVSFTSSVTNIGDGPFYDCTGLTTITMTGPTTNTYISVSNNVIFNKAQTSLIQFPGGLTGAYTIPATVTNVSEAFIGNRLTSIAVAASNPVLSGLGGVLFNKSQTQLIEYPGSAIGTYTVPSSVTTIFGSSFEYSVGVSSVTIGPNVSSIGYVAFFDAAGLTSISVNAASPYFTSVNGVLFDKNVTQLIQYPISVAGGYVIPGTVTNIADGAFGNALSLTSVVIPNSVTYIGYESFYACTSLASLTIGSSVTNIAQQAFWLNQALKSVVFPASIKTLSAYAFGGCQSLTNACFEGNAPVDGGSVFYFDSALTSILHVNGTTGWGSFYDGIATAPCTTCGSVGPQLNINRAGTNVVLTWLTNYTGYTLQAETNVALTNWSTVSPAAVIVSNQYAVTNAVPGNRKFYRLIK